MNERTRQLLQQARERHRQERNAPERVAARNLDLLAVYNAECARGIMHTPEWDAKMADLQREFDA